LKQFDTNPTARSICQALIDQLSKGKKYVTGQRQIYVANVFVTGKSVHLSGKPNSIITTKEQAGSQDFLANVPVF
jgi:hypothetical protein